MSGPLESAQPRLIQVKEKLMYDTGPEEPPAFKKNQEFPPVFKDSFSRALTSPPPPPPSVVQPEVVAVATKSRPKLPRSMFVFLIGLGSSFYFFLVADALLIGVLYATGVIQVQKATTFYYYCPSGYNIYFPTFNVPASKSTGSDWSNFRSFTDYFQLFTYPYFTIALCGTDTSSSNKYVCKVRFTTNSINFESYCASSCQANSFVDCNTATITTVPLVNAVPTFDLTVPDGTTNLPKRLFASSNFKYVECPSTSFQKVITNRN